MPPPSDRVSAGETYHRGRKWGQAVLPAGVVVGAALLYSLIRYRPFRVEVTGPSMSPTLEPGDWAVAVPARRVRAGDVVVIEHPEHRGFEMVKRVVAGPSELAPGGHEMGAEEFWVEGDDPARSTDSRHFGPIGRDRIKARVRLIYWPPERRRVF